MAGRRTTYVRDANGRFASTPGGRSSSRGKSITRGRTALIRARQSVRQAQRKLAAFDPADESIKASLSKRAQRGAVTRAQKQLKAVAKTSIIKAPRQAGVISKTRRRAAAAPAVAPVKAAAPAAAPKAKRGGKPAAAPAAAASKPKPKARAKAPAAAPAPAPVKAAAAPTATAGKPKAAKPQPRNKGPKGKTRWLSNDQVVQANQAKSKGVRATAETMRSKLPKKIATALGVSTLGGYIAKVSGKPLSFDAANRVKDQIERITGIGRGQLQGVRTSIDNARKTVTYGLSPIARRQAVIAEKVGSRKPRRSRAKAPAAAPAPAPVKSAAPRRGRVRGARPAGTIAKPKGLKPGALAARMKARQTTPSTRRPNPRAERAKAAANRTGVVKGKNFTHGQDVKTMSLAELRTAVRQHARQGGPMSRKEFMFMYALPSGVVTTGRNGMEQGRMPRTRGDWEKIYKDVIGLPQAERNRKDRPGVINGIDIHGSFRPGAVFGLSMKTATADDVNRAYRRLARQHHPDAGGRRRDFERLTQMRDSMLALMRSDFGSGKGKAKGKGNGKGKGAAAAPAAARGPRLLPPASTPVRSAAAAPKVRARSAAAPTATAGKPKTKTQAARSPSGSKRQTTVQRYIDMRRRLAAIGSGRTGVKAENSRKVRARAALYDFSLFVRTQGRLPNFSPNATTSSQDRLAVKRIKKTAEAIYGRTEAAKRQREWAATMGGAGRPSAISRSQRGRNGKGDKVSAPAPAPAQMRVLRGDTPRRIRGARPAGTIAKVTARSKAPTQASAKSTRTVYRTKDQATRAYRARTNVIGSSTGGRRGVFSRQRIPQFNVWGRVEMVGAGKFHRIGKRAGNGRIIRSQRTSTPVPGSRSFQREMDRLTAVRAAFVSQSRRKR